MHTVSGPNTPEIERRIYEFTPGNPDQDDLEVRTHTRKMVTVSPGAVASKSNAGTTEALRLTYVFIDVVYGVQRLF